MSEVGPISTNPGVPSTPMGKEDYSQVGACTPMTSGFINPKPNFTSRTSGQYKNFKREQEPTYRK